MTLEGPEGAGKTTHAARLRDAFAEAGIDVRLVREPGGTPVGEAVRALLLRARGSDAPMSPRADALLFNAARAQLVDEAIRPALEAGTTVICTRFADSTLAYQGYGMGILLDDLQALQEFATGGLSPDLTVLLDLPVEIGLGRKRGDETRFESDFDLAFHRRVRDGFLAIAAAEPDRFATLDATAGPDAVFAGLIDAVRDRLGVSLPGPHRGAGSEPNSPTLRITG